MTKLLDLGFLIRVLRVLKIAIEEAFLFSPQEVEGRNGETN